MLRAPWENTLTDKEKPDRYADIGAPIPSDFVLARFPDGTPRALFSHDSWEFGGGMEEQISFNNIVEPDLINDSERYSELIYQCKVIMFALIYTPRIRSQRIQPSTLRSRLKVIRRTAKMLYLNGISFSDMEASADFQNQLKSSIASLGNGWSNTAAAYQTKVTFSEFHKAYEVGALELISASRIYPLIDAEAYDALIKRSINSLRSKGNDRTLLLPRRILANIIDKGLQLIDEIHPYAFHPEDCAISNYGRLFIDNPQKLSFQEKLDLSGLSRFTSTHNIQSYDELRTHISMIRDICRILIHAFTGMRDNEVSVLPYHCYQEHFIPNYGVVPFIQSHHRKMKKRNYSGSVHWVTSPEMKKVVEVAQAIAIFQVATGAKVSNPDTKFMPLWVGSISKAKRSNDHYSFPLKKLTPGQALWKRLAESLDLFTTQEDLDELFKFDAYRDWQSEINIAVGKPFPIATHMFRRSLAVYAARSGMVSLPSLGTQYKHISLLMTAMYAENSSYAELFVEKNADGSYREEFAIINDFNEERANVSAAQFHEETIDRTRPLHGPKGNVIQRQKDNNALDVTYLDREATAKAMKDKRNPMRYASTVVGGCLRGSVCESYALDIVVPCTKDCSDAILMDERIEAYVSDLEAGLYDIDENSMEYKITAQEIAHIRKIDIKEVL